MCVFSVDFFFWRILLLCFWLWPKQRYLDVDKRERNSKRRKYCNAFQEWLLTRWTFYSAHIFSHNILPDFWLHTQGMIAVVTCTIIIQENFNKRVNEKNTQKISLCISCVRLSCLLISEYYCVKAAKVCLVDCLDGKFTSEIFYLKVLCSLYIYVRCLEKRMCGGWICM